MKATLIISVYKNIFFLKSVLDSLKVQTEKSFEIIISEDGCNDEMKQFILQYPFEQPYQHLYQKDEGWQKNKALNNAIKAAKGDWLIFIDGDCVLHERFIEMHLHFAEEKLILAGKRVKLDKTLSNFLLQGGDVTSMQKKLRQKLFLRKGDVDFLEEGIFISPKNVFSFITGLRKNNKLVGCNMSFSKKAIYSINGFDEDYILPAFGEDRDLSWRFIKAGYQHFSLRNLAIVYHLDHPVGWTNQEENLEIYRSKLSRNEYICKNGLVKLD